MIDLKAHVFYGKSFLFKDTDHIYLILLSALLVFITCFSFFLNAVFGFAISVPGKPNIRLAYKETIKHWGTVIFFGVIVGCLLAFSTLFTPKLGKWWFAVSLSIVVGIMMICYVAIPSRLIGMKKTNSRRDRLVTTAMGGVLGFVVCTPPYLLGRLGLLLLGSNKLFILGIILLMIGLILEAGATSAVKTVKMGSKLTKRADMTT